MDRRRAEPPQTTAIAFQFNPPDACAPQSVLLAVPPVPDQPWTVASLHRVLVETLDLAKLRAVDAELLITRRSTCQRCICVQCEGRRGVEISPR
jgi:hypothetical protein